MKKHFKRVFVATLLLSVIGGIVYTGLWFHDLVSVKTPEHMLNVDKSTKLAGHHQIHQEKTNDYFIVQHFPKTDIEALDEWILSSTQEMREHVKAEWHNTIAPNDAPQELLQDFHSSITGDIFSVRLLTYLNNTLIDQRARTYNIDKQAFMTPADFFSTPALRILTNTARKTLEPKEMMSRHDFLKAVNLLDNTQDFYLKESIIHFHFDASFDFEFDMNAHAEFANNATEPLPLVYVSKGVDPEQKLIALTFDDGPNKTLTPQVLDLLDEFNAQATFFMLGRNVNGNDDIIRDIASRGHQIANHTMHHPNLKAIPIEEAIAQVMDTEARIQNITNDDQPLFVRPPYGEINPGLRKTINRVFINWSVDSEDWKSKDPEAICKKIDHDAFNGSIVLMHDIHKETVESLRCTLEALTNSGYTMVSVRELLEARGIEPTQGNLYREAR